LESEELFIGALRLLGIAEGSREWRDALDAWRAYQKQHL
jgi:hypothetical protein